MPIHAPAKLNLCLFLGRPRPDGLHEICSLFEPLSLADLIRVGDADRDEVLCEGVVGENLASRALEELRGRGWERPPVRIEIEKRIPVAAGLGGGSADAAAVLRLAAGELSELEQAAASIGADVPSQLTPSLALVRGAGERVARLPRPRPHAVVLLPGGGGLSTAEVYAEADRLGLGREGAELEALSKRLLTAAGAGGSPLEYADLLENDLERAARSLRPEVGEALEDLRAAGAPASLMTGSGPTVFGLFEGITAAREAAARLGRDDAIVCAAGTAGEAG